MVKTLLSSAGSTGSIPGWGTETPTCCAVWLQNPKNHSAKHTTFPLLIRAPVTLDSGPPSMTSSYLMTPERPRLQIRSHLQRYQGSGLHLSGGAGGNATELMTRFRAVVFTVCFCICGPWHRAWRYVTACRGVMGANTRADGVRMSSLSSVVDPGSSGDCSHPSPNGLPGWADVRGRPLPGSTVDVSRCLSTFLPQQSQLSEEVKQPLLSLAFEILLTVSLSSKKKRKKKTSFSLVAFSSGEPGGRRGGRAGSPKLVLAGGGCWFCWAGDSGGRRLPLRDLPRLGFRPAWHPSSRGQEGMRGRHPEGPWK